MVCIVRSNGLEGRKFEAIQWLRCFMADASRGFCPNFLQGNILLRPRPSIHDRVDYRDHENCNNSTCKSIII